MIININIIILIALLTTIIINYQIIYILIHLVAYLVQIFLLLVQIVVIIKNIISIFYTHNIVIVIKFISYFTILYIYFQIIFQALLIQQNIRINVNLF